MRGKSYRKAFFIALTLHLLIGLLLIMESVNQRPVITSAMKNESSQALPIEKLNQPQVEIVKATSIDSQELMSMVNHLKRERDSQLKAEQARQQDLARQAEMARNARLQEQQRLIALKDEAEKLAIAQKKQMEKEQQHLKELAVQKELETKRLAELKEKQQKLRKKRQEETERLVLLRKKQAEEKRQAAAQAALEAAKKAQIAGEIDKYKALIINAIGQQWILPENVDKNLSSQFRIRLAPSGTVLEVSLIRSSGDAILDRSAQTAIYKASPLPVPADPMAFDLFRDISLTVRPENVRG
jgi:colicin import membrane protein